MTHPQCDHPLDEDGDVILANLEEYIRHLEHPYLPDNVSDSARQRHANHCIAEAKRLRKVYKIK